ncbi:MAG: nucleoside recognition domain-containing protein [Bacillota bacterium]
MGTYSRKTLLAFLITIFFLLMIAYPAAIYRGATNGLSIWWQIIFPSLLPFFITTELLLALGVIQFFGALLEPLTQRVFRLPGAAAFAIAVGYTSGYPMGAAVAARLKSQELLSASQSARLAAFTNNASPLFILVAVSVGMYQNPALGPFLAGVHYLSNVLTGITLGLFARPTFAAVQNPWQRAVNELARTRRNDLRNMGQLAGESIRHAVNSLFVIAGFICIFAVVLQLFNEVPILQALLHFVGSVLQRIGLLPELWPALGAGFFEVTLGAKTAAAADAPLIEKLLMTQVIFAWSGLSVIMQALSFLSAAKVPGSIFLLGRFLQALFACALTYALFPFFAPRLAQTAAALPTAAPSFTAILTGAAVLCITVNLSLIMLALLVLTGCKLKFRCRQFFRQ